MKTYRVSWEIDIDASSPEDAARKARTTQLDPTAQVGHFTVTLDGFSTDVDLDLDDKGVTCTVDGVTYLRVGSPSRGRCTGCSAYSDGDLCATLREEMGCAKGKVEQWIWVPDGIPEFTLDVEGVKYRTIPTPNGGRGSCEGCVAQHDVSLCDALSGPCFSRVIVWVRPDTGRGA